MDIGVVTGAEPGKLRKKLKPRNLGCKKVSKEKGNGQAASQSGFKHPVFSCLKA